MGTLLYRSYLIGTIKEETKVSDMGASHPSEFSLYLKYCRALKFSETPDYSYLINLFKYGGSEDARCGGGGSCTHARMQPNASFHNQT